MKNVLILGASGKIALLVEKMLDTQKDIHQTLYLRHLSKLPDKNQALGQVILGDVMDTKLLTRAMEHQDLVYANLAGKNIFQQAQNVITSMQQQVRRLVWISTLGIYNEVPGDFGKWNSKMLGSSYLSNYKKAAASIEASNLDYTIIRPACLQDLDEVDYEITTKEEPFKGTKVSRKSVASLITKIITQPQLYLQQSVGVNKPDTTGERRAGVK